ncbi:MAG: hypothetical protein E7I59_01145 [Phytobacter diazotrophicus]|jgi:hypothetical protein|nr:hypothetical protein [Phytobacter diazotrophicus]DAO81332.1 MAG TPA: hypothetical protein [Caudoviricetes sp.]
MIQFGKRKMTYKIINNNPKNYKVNFTIDGVSYSYHSDTVNRYVLKDKQRITYYGRKTMIDGVSSTVPDFILKLLTLPVVDEKTFQTDVKKTKKKPQ